MAGAGPTPFVVERVDDVAVVALASATHGPDAEVLSETLGDLIAGGGARVVVDLSGTHLVNSKLLDTLVQVSGRLDPRRGEAIVVVTGADYMRHMLEISAEGGLLLLAESRDEAMETLGVP